MVGNWPELKSESFIIPFQLWHEFPKWPKAGNLHLPRAEFAICKTGLASPVPSYTPFSFVYINCKCRWAWFCAGTAQSRGHDRESAAHLGKVCRERRELGGTGAGQDAGMKDAHSRSGDACREGHSPGGPAAYQPPEPAPGPAPRGGEAGAGPAPGRSAAPGPARRRGGAVGRAPPAPASARPPRGAAAGSAGRRSLRAAAVPAAAAPQLGAPRGARGAMEEPPPA